MSCPLHSNDNSCAGCAKIKIKALERQLAEARGRVTVILDLVYNELAGLEDDTRVEYLYFRIEELEQLKEKGDDCG
jgi:hypothetical protein